MDMGNPVLNTSILAPFQKLWGVGGSYMCLGVWKLWFTNLVPVFGKPQRFKIPLNTYMYACKSDIYVHSLIDIVHNRAPRVSTRVDNHCCHVLKSLWMTLALVCRWEAAYGRDFPNCRGLHAYPLKLKIHSLALKISEHPFASFFWVTPWNQLTVSFHWQ